MSWVEWLKGLADRSSEEGSTPPDAPRKPEIRRPRQKESYAREWVKVLEDSNPGRSPYDTYTWELKPEHEKPLPAKESGNRKAAAAQDPFDTYTWELQEGKTSDDPWGLQDAAATQPPRKKDGVNPYDTGIFDATWTGQFDKR